MKISSVAIIKQTASYTFFGILLLMSGCAVTPDGTTSSSMNNLTQIVTGLGEAVMPNSKKPWRQVKIVMNSVTNVVKHQEAEAQQRQAAELKRLEAERARLAFEAMTPEQKTEYLETKQRNELAAAGMLLMFVDAMFGSGSSGSTIGDREETIYYEQSKPSAPAYGGGFNAPAINPFYD